MPVKGLSTLNTLTNPKVPGLFWPWKEGGGHYPLFAQFVKSTDKSWKYWKKVPPIKQIIYGISKKGGIGVFHE